MRTITWRGSERLLVNPGIGFFAAPGLEDAASPLLPEERWRFEGSERAWNHPDSGVGFVSGRWARIEREEGHHDFSAIDEALERLGSERRLAVLRVAPYALGDDDIPAWLRARNPDRPDFPFWQVDPNTSDSPCWARFVCALARHLDGHPFLSSVDMALVGAWGEGGGTEFMAKDKQRLIIDAYLQGFTQTPMQCLLHDPDSVGYIRQSGLPVGFRVDCLGDMGGFHGKRWSHMLDFYPQNIANFGMSAAWERGPVLFEACWTMQDWYRNGWDIDYIIQESLKWHISAFNSKGVPVPTPWKSQASEWVRRMGYRLAPRLGRHSAEAGPGQPLKVSTLWLNSGAAPCYQPYQLSYRLTDARGTTHDLSSSVDIRRWLPGEDQWVEDRLSVDALPPGDYALSLGILTGHPGFPPLALACEGQGTDGFLPMGSVRLGARGGL